MLSKKWIITGCFVMFSVIGLTILTSSSSTDNLMPIENTTCCKAPIKDCDAKDADQGIIHESLSRQFLIITFH